MGTQYNPERPNNGVPVRRYENGAHRTTRPTASRYNNTVSDTQRPTNGQMRRPAAGSSRRQPPRRRRPNGRFYALIAIVLVALILVGILLFKLAKPSGDPTSNVVNPTQAAETPTAAPTDDSQTSDEPTDPEATTETSRSEALAAMLGNSETSVAGLAADQMAVIEDLCVNPDLSDEWFNVLFLGSDERVLSESARTDCMMICSINMSSGEVKLTSIMRDLAVNYDEIGDFNGIYRINAANFFGGEELAMRVVNECFGMNIEHYVRVNFYGFQQIAQQLGGIEMDITKEEMDEINYRIVEQAKAAYLAGIDESALPNQYLETYGENTHLDGRQTLAYARIRKLDGGDYARSERQRKVLVALMNKLQGSDAATLLGVANAALPHIKTNLTPDELLNIALKVLQSGLSDVASFRLPVNSSYTQETRDGQDMLYDCDWAKNSSELYYFIYE